ncbi:MAG TPA: MFS transporter [Pseudonocardiaceae bacterium]|jgi:predicted MFS family arabinose efflux permease|nr:MFS transporter [Pseudonocardiaceae bacterium]
MPTSARSGTAGRALVPSLVFIGMVVAIISSLGAPLIPTVALDDHVSVSAAQWSLTITFLVSALATPTMGRLGDGPHRRTVIIGSLGVVAVGGALAALPLGFGFLLVGRALQGVGLGLTPMGIAVARDVLPVERARPTVALLSITTAAGVGLGYPITGLIAEYGGLHTAFWFGAVVAVLALVVAVVVVPASVDRPPQRLDVPGALLLGIALAGLLLAISEGASWGWGSGRLIGLAVLSLAVFAAWVLVELRRPSPLVQLRLLRLRAVLTADVLVLLAGVGMYLLIALVTRFVQTPSSTGYGLGVSVAVAGLVLIPFSVGSLVATKVMPALIRRTSIRTVLPLGSVVVLLATVLFTYARTDLWEVVVMMGITGLGIGMIFAVLPGLIVGAVPPEETGSATSFNQVLRYIGYAAGSAISAVVLAADTPPGQPLPVSDGYTVAGLIGCATWVVTAVTSVLLPRFRARATSAAPRAAHARTES